METQHPTNVPTYGAQSDQNKRLRKIAPAIINWQRTAGRNHLPWQNTTDPYRVWLSEIMLQQTQVSTVIPYYEKFLERFPDVTALATGSQDEVMALWAGLGYYSRARNLHACAKRILLDWSGKFPEDSDTLETLPGIGRSTAAAIAAFCYGERAAILDGNVRRVFCRYFGITGDPTSSQTLAKLWELAEQALPDPSLIEVQSDSMRRYTQGLMDLGAMACTRTRPDCTSCPLQPDCFAYSGNCTNTLPNPKVRKARQQKDVHLLLMTHRNAVLLCKRPDKGIWAGMWSLPEAQNETDLLTVWEDPASKDIYTAMSVDLQPMAAFTHELTHFKMVIKPWHLALPDSFDRSLKAIPQGAEWVSDERLNLYGMPAPVRPLIEAVIRPSSHS